MADADASAKSRLEKWGHIADIFSKLAVGAVVAIVGIVLTYTKNASDIASQCSQTTRSIFEAATSKKYARDVLSEMAHWIPTNCQVDRSHFVDVLSAVSQGAQAQASTPQTPVGPAAPPGPNSTQGWVAVGYENADMNFTTSDNQTIRTAPKAGQKLRPKTQVNVRPGPADWSNVNFVLSTARCFKVDETRTLSAGDLKQIWARGSAVDCS